MTLSNLKFKDEDGGDEDFSLESVNIEVVDNGFLITFSYNDEELKEVFNYNNRKEMMKSLSERLGV